MPEDQAYEPIDLEIYLREVAEQHGFAIDTDARVEKVELKQYYPGAVRRVVLRGTYMGEKCVLLGRNDPRGTAYYTGLTSYRSNMGTRAKLVDVPWACLAKQSSPYLEWLMLRALPAGAFFKVSMLPGAREYMVQRIAEYHSIMPKNPPLPMGGKYNRLTADAWAHERFEKWTEEGTKLLAANSSSQMAEVLELVGRAGLLVQEVWSGRPLVWSHNFPAPHKWYHTTDPTPVWYLTGWGATKFAPLEYALAMCIWGDSMMTSLATPYDRWEAQIFNWVDLFLAEETFREQTVRRLLLAALLERAIGSMLMDIPVLQPWEARMMAMNCMVVFAERLIQKIEGENSNL